MCCAPPPPPHTHKKQYISRGHSVCANAVGFGIFPGAFELLVRCAKISFPSRQLCVYFLKSVRFRNVWVKAGGGGVSGHIFEQTAGNLIVHGTEQCTGDR